MTTSAADYVGYPIADFVWCWGEIQGGHVPNPFAEALFFQDRQEAGGAVLLLL
jgi:hypothetical protein